MGDEKIIRIMCPNLNCQRVLGVPAHARGKLVRCRGCGTTIRIPLQADERPSEAEPQEPAA